MKNQGFTLVELLVVIGIFALILSGTIGIFALILKNKLRTKEILDVRREGGNAISIVNREITGAKSVSNEELTYDTSLKFTNLDGNIIEIGCLVADTDPSVEQLLIGGNVLIDEADGKLDISNCTFNFSPNEKGNYSVDFSFQLGIIGKEPETFRTFAVTRNVIN